MTEWQLIDDDAKHGGKVLLSRFPYDGHHAPYFIGRWSKGGSKTKHWRANGRPLLFIPTHYFDPETLPEPQE